MLKPHLLSWTLEHWTCPAEQVGVDSEAHHPTLTSSPPPHPHISPTPTSPLHPTPTPPHPPRYISHANDNRELSLPTVTQ